MVKRVSCQVTSYIMCNIIFIIKSSFNLYQVKHGETNQMQSEYLEGDVIILAHVKDDK